MIETKESVKQILTDYLDKKGLRKTPERFIILEEIYSISGYFDVDYLFLLLKEHKINISRATVYNTVDLLAEIHLIKKDKFGKNTFRYERAYESLHHHHLICSRCGLVIEFTDPRIMEIQDAVEHLKEFKVDYHSLYFYGICKECNKLT